MATPNARNQIQETTLSLVVDKAYLEKYCDKVSTLSHPSQFEVKLTTVRSFQITLALAKCSTDCDSIRDLSLEMKSKISLEFHYNYDRFAKFMSKMNSLGPSLKDVAMEARYENNTVDLKSNILPPFSI